MGLSIRTREVTKTKWPKATCVITIAITIAITVITIAITIAITIRN